MTLDAPETEIVAKSRIACDGPGPSLGHPRVWLQIAEETGFVECGYCDKRFILKGGPADPADRPAVDPAPGGDPDSVPGRVAEPGGR